MTLLLVNHHSHDIELSLPLRRGPRLPTTPIRVPAAGAIDPLKVHGLEGREPVEVRAIIEASSDYQHFLKKRWLMLTDPTESRREKAWRFFEKVGQPPSGVLAGSPEGMSTNEYDALLDRMFPADRLPPPGDPSPGPEAEKVLNPIVKRMLEQQKYVPERVMLPVDEATSPDDDDKPETGASGPQLDPTAKEAISEGIPSTKWDLEKLVELAKKKGVELPEKPTKSYILRKLRGM